MEESKEEIRISEEQLLTFSNANYSSASYLNNMLFPCDAFQFNLFHRIARGFFVPDIEAFELAQVLIVPDNANFELHQLRDYYSSWRRPPFNGTYDCMSAILNVRHSVVQMLARNGNRQIEQQ